MRTASKEASAEGSKLLARYLEDHPELGVASDNKGDFYTIGIAVQEQVERKMQPVLEQFDPASRRSWTGTAISRRLLWPRRR